MFAVSLLQIVKKSCSAKLKTITLPVRQSHVNSIKILNSTGSGTASSRVENDVVLYTLEKPKFFITVNIISALQCFLWTYLGFYIYDSLKKAEFKVEGKTFWKKMLETERKYSGVLASIAVVFGWATFAGTCFYTTRTVRKLILHRGGRNVTIITYALPGFKDKMQVPLSEISASVHRPKAKKYLPFKIKNRFFFYMFDIKGEFTDPALFDCTVGVKRNL